MAQQNPAKKATLIEVLMVILIVGIIVILVFPSIGEKRNKDRMNLEVFPTFEPYCKQTKISIKIKAIMHLI